MQLTQVVGLCQYGTRFWLVTLEVPQTVQSGLQCQGMAVVAAHGKYELAALTGLLIFGELQHISVSC